MKLCDDLSFNFPRALLAFRSLQKLDWSNSSFFGSILYFFSEGAIEEFDAFTVLGRKRGADENVLPSGTLPEVSGAWLLEGYLHYRDVVSAAPCYHGEAPLSQESDPDAFTASLSYYFDVDGEASWHLVYLNGADKLSEHTVLNPMFTKLQETCHPADAAVPLSMTHVADFVFESVIATLSSAVSSIDPSLVPQRCLS